MALGDHPLVGEARGMGLVGALELAARQAREEAVRSEEAASARAVVRNAEAEGLIVRVDRGRHRSRSARR